MLRIVGSLIACGLIACAGCGEKPKVDPSALPLPSGGPITSGRQTATAVLNNDVAPPDLPETDDVGEEPDAVDAVPLEQQSAEPVELKLEGISFVIPGGWKAVKPPNRIIEAEFELPHADGDDHDGRLTLMSSGGDPEEAIATRSAEFNREPGVQPQIEKIKVGEIEATWVDLRGEWKGPSFRPVEPRSDYRMLLVIVPFTSRSAFYAKLTGPQATVAAREQEFRKFIQSAQITRAAQ
ncbi:MAG: hypothetical protein EXS05_10090 [Planctomycetaceae bacterium]|nr:hypothetical protein [Planctomycetaceae bacterium]